MKTEIIKNEINWNKPQLLKGITSDIILMTTGKHKENIFEVMIIHGKAMSGDGPGYFYDEWNKNAFRYFDGELKIKN